jgi:hypothetical protein
MIVTIEYVTLFSTNNVWLVSHDERLYSFKNADFAVNQWLTMAAALPHPKITDPILSFDAKLHGVIVANTLHSRLIPFIIET